MDSSKLKPSNKVLAAACLIAAILLCIGGLFFLQPTNSDYAYGIVTDSETPNEDSTVMQYSELSEADKDKFRRSPVYQNGETVKEPRIELSEQVEGVDYIQLDGTYYRVIEYQDTISTTGLSVLIVIAVGLLFVLGLILAGVFFASIEHINENYFEVKQISNAQAILILNVLILLVTGAVVHAQPADKDMVIETTEVEQVPDSATVTQFESLNWTQQYDFKHSLREYDGLTEADDSLTPIIGEYIQSDGEYYKVTANNRRLSSLFTSFLFPLLFGNLLALFWKE